MSIRWSRIGLFYGVSLLGISAAALTLFALGEGVGQLLSTIITAAAMFAPLCGVLVVQGVDGAPLLRDIGAGLRLSRWLFFAAALGLGIAVATVLVGAALPGTSWDWEMNALFARLSTVLSQEEIAEARDQIADLPVHPVFLAIPQAVIAGMTINALFAFGEEIGWRGFLQRELAPLGFWGSSLLTGVLWGLWHSPLILMGHNYPTQRVAGVFVFTLVCTLLAPLHSFVRLRAGTVWAAAVLHGTFNATAVVAMMVIAGGELVVGVQGLAGILALAGVNLLLLAVVGRARGDAARRG